MTLTARLEQAVATLPLNPRLVVFESMMGWQYSDSPRAIYEEMLRQGTDATMVWSAQEGAHFPGGVPTVTRRSPEWLEALATAAIWIDNQGLPRALPKPARVRYLQTWHGTPLKLMGWNNPSLADATPQAADRLQRTIDRWDAITVPSEYFVETIVDAFRSRADVLRVGLPRNDVLTRPMTAESRAERLRAIGVRDDTLLVLYAPTSVGESSEPSIAPAAAIAETGAHVLFRAHYSDARRSRGTMPSGITDVSRVADMADLLAVADILVTDYSSSMFDFCLTDRPIILLQPENDGYAAARGTYFDIRSFSPGPIASTLPELAGLVRSVDTWTGDWAPSRSAYRSRFATYEQGDAAQRTVAEYIAPILAGRA